MRTLQHPTFMLNKLAGVKFDTTAAMLAKTGDELWRFDCSFAHGRYSNVLCPVRPPQTAIGRTAGTLLGSAPVPVAVFGVAPKTVSQTEWFQQWFRRDAKTRTRDACAPANRPSQNEFKKRVRFKCGIGRTHHSGSPSWRICRVPPARFASGR